MNTYIAKLIFNIRKGESHSQFDEQLRMIEAFDEAEALEKANKLGKAEEEVFLDEQTRRISWKFVAVSDLYQTEAQKDGMLLYSFTETPEDNSEYLAFVQSRSYYLQQQYTKQSVLH